MNREAGDTHLQGAARPPRHPAAQGQVIVAVTIASIFADFGATVWLLEFAPTLVPAADPGVSAALRAAFEARWAAYLASLDGAQS